MPFVFASGTVRHLGKAHRVAADSLGRFRADLHARGAARLGYRLARGISGGDPLRPLGFPERGLLPLGNLFAALPIVGVAPIMVMWFGFDWHSKAAVVVIMTFFPMLVNAVTGLQAAGHLERDLMRSYGASWLQTLLKLRLPAAMPFIFNALKINSTLAMIGAIVAEFFGTPIVGMGFRISTEVGRLGSTWFGPRSPSQPLRFGLLRVARAHRARSDLLASVLPEVSGNLEQEEDDHNEEDFDSGSCGDMSSAVISLAAGQSARAEWPR